MATLRIPLSGSTDGRPIKVAATASPGTTIHTAVTGVTEADLIYLWVANTDSSARTITVQWGGTTDPDDAHPKSYSIAANSIPTPVAFGQPLRNGLIVKAFASSANVLTITGFAMRVTR